MPNAEGRIRDLAFGVRHCYDCVFVPEPERGFLSPGSLKYLQENLRRSGPVAAAGYTLIGSIILLGGLGYALDWWRGTSPWFLLGGLLLGIVVGFYELAKIIWRR
jgi:hypothetical protein